MARAGWSLAPDDDAAEMYLWSLERLEAAGYRQYEISNVARPGRRVAPQPQVLAGRRVAGVRLRRALHAGRRPLEECLRDRGLHRRGSASGAAAGRAKRASLSALERAEEALFTGLRLAEGMNSRRSDAGTASTPGRALARALAPFIAGRRLLREGDRIRLTREGMLIANEVMSVFV